MTQMQDKIAAGLERAFATSGFAEPSVEDLRDAAGVSLRTLYKYAPSRDDMVLMALEHRHQRYLTHVFGSHRPPAKRDMAELLDRIADWMQTEASHGCLFHAAVAAAPTDKALRDLLERHKKEVSNMAVAASGTDLSPTDVMVIFEGLTQSWSLSKSAALDSAKRLAKPLQQA